MLRKHLLFYALTCLVAFGLSNCSYYDEPSAPAKSSVTVDKTSGLSGITEFTFTVTQVSAQNISLLPEGEGRPGILIDASSFSNGTATVKYTYSDIGSFNAVVRTNSHSADGKTVKNVVSDPVAITITSHENEMKDFSFSSPNSTSTTISGNNVTVILPYNPFHSKTTLTPNFTVSSFASVKLNGTAQTSGSSTINFTQPSTQYSYDVVSAAGDINTYNVTITVMPVGTDNTVKSASGTVTGGALDKKTYSAYVDNTNSIITVVLPNEGTDAMLSGIKFNYETNDTTARGDLAKDYEMDLTGANTGTLKVTAQDGTLKTFTVYGVVAPAFDIQITNLNPVPEGTRSGFGISINVLKGTDLTNLDFTYTADASVQDVQYNNATFVNGSSVDYSTTSPQKFYLKVLDAKGVTYWTMYSVDVLPVP